MIDAKIVMESVRNASARKASLGLKDFFGFFGGKPPPVVTFAAQGTHVPLSDIISAAVFCESEREACTRSARLCGCAETGDTGISHGRGEELAVESDSEVELLICIQIAKSWGKNRRNKQEY